MRTSLLLAPLSLAFVACSENGGSVTGLDDIQPQRTWAAAPPAAMRGLAVTDVRTFEPPGATFSAAMAVGPRGTVAGSYFTGGAWHGYVSEGDRFTTVDVPGTTETEILGLSSAGEAVGTYVVGGAIRGFRLRHGKFRLIDVQGAPETLPQDVNARGHVVGFSDLSGPRGFLLRESVFTPVAVPGAQFTEPRGINDRGDIVGTSIGVGTHGFVRRRGIVRTISVPGASWTQAHGITSAETSSAPTRPGARSTASCGGRASSRRSTSPAPSTRAFRTSAPAAKSWVTTCWARASAGSRRGFGMRKLRGWPSRRDSRSRRRNWMEDTPTPIDDRMLMASIHSWWREVRLQNCGDWTLAAPRSEASRGADSLPCQDWNPARTSGNPQSATHMTSIRARWPGAAPSRRSRVTSGASSNSAKAT